MSSIFGSGGLLHNRALEKAVKQLAYQNEVLALQTQGLQNQKQSMTGSDALKDAAFRYGYQSEGEQVYYFEQSDGKSVIANPAPTVADFKKPSFDGLSNLIIAALTLCVSLVITLSYAIILRKRKNEY